MDRLQGKYKLFTKLGALLGPLHRLVDHSEQYDDQEAARVIARFCSEYRPLATEMREFCEGEPGHNYSIQHSRFFNALDAIKVGLEYDSKLADLLHVNAAKAQAAIDAIPIPVTSVILEAGSPFTTYCRIRELIESDGIGSLGWFDPYVDESIFHRYLQHARGNAAITLVTCEPRANASAKEQVRWKAFLDISKLFASERGPQAYRLIMYPSLHDRWLVLDEKRIYSLGGSVKDAAARDVFTLASLDSTPANLAAITQHIQSGTELFGPSTTTHK